MTFVTKAFTYIDMEYNYYYNTPEEELVFPEEEREFVIFMRDDILRDYQEIMTSCEMVQRGGGSINQIWQVYDISPALMSHYFKEYEDGRRMLHELKKNAMTALQEIVAKVAAKTAISEAMLKARIKDILAFHGIVDSYGYICKNKYDIEERHLITAFRTFPFLGDVAASVCLTHNELIAQGEVYRSVGEELRKHLQSND